MTSRSIYCTSRRANNIKKGPPKGPSNLNSRYPSTIEHTGGLGGPLVPRPTGILSSNTCPVNSNIPEYTYNITCQNFLFKKLLKRLWNTCEKFVCNRKTTFLGVFRAMWRNRIHATYKTGMERICHTCVTLNAFEICDEFVRILHTLWRIRANNSHVWKIRSVNIKVQQGLDLLS